MVKPKNGMIRTVILALGVQMAFGFTGLAAPARVNCAPSRCHPDLSATEDGASTSRDNNPAGAQSAPATATPAGTQSATATTTPTGTAAPAGTPHGKKLVLKDGTFQLTREYQKNGDRVRYFSIERGEWEEIPGSLVDWDATKKAEAADQKTSDALLEKARIQAEAARMDPPLDVDASLTVAKGVFLPEGEGMFVLEGKTVRALTQAGSQVKTDKKTVLKQVLSPIPIVPGKKNVELPGSKAAVRVTTSTPEFYLREPAFDPERASSIERTGRQNESGPDVMLVRVKVKGNKRYVESVKSLFGQEIGQERDEISVQRWEVARDVYRFTMSEPLKPGEYALAEILDDGLNLFVWDFAVDAAAPAAQSPK